jgi:hypothetical protein
MVQPQLEVPAHQLIAVTVKEALLAMVVPIAQMALTVKLSSGNDNCIYN